jgi:hypothetical protein
MIKKYRLQIIVIFLLGLVAVFLHAHRERTSLGRRNINIAVTSSVRVNEIIISDNDSYIKLLKGEEGWILSSGHAVREKAAELLLQTLERLQVSGPAPLSQVDEINEKLLKESLRVDISEGRRSRSYRIYSAGGSQPTYMRMNGNRSVFKVEVVGFTGNVASLFIPEENYWRSNILYNYKPSEIREVMVLHGENNDDSFILTQFPANNFSLSGYPDGNRAGDLNDSLAIRYLAGFYYVPYERIAEPAELLLSDSLMKARPDYTLRIKKHNGDISEAKFHRIIVKASGDHFQFDLFRMHAVTDGGSMIVIPYHSVDLLLRPYSWFLGR